MVNKSSTFFLVAAAAITAWAARGVSVAAQARAIARPDLTGQWQLNSDLSENTQEKLQSMAGGGVRAGQGGGGHGPGRHGGFAGIGGGGHTRLEEVHNVILNAPTRFLLTQDAREVVMTDRTDGCEDCPRTTAR